MLADYTRTFIFYAKLLYNYAPSSPCWHKTEKFISMFRFVSQIQPRGYTNFFMLNSAEHEIFSANK